MATFTQFDPADVQSNLTAQKVTSGLWSNGSTLDGTTGLGFFTASTQGATTESFYHIYDYSSTDSNAKVQFDIAYGHYAGSGSTKEAGATDGLTPTRAVYSQWRNLLLEPGTKKFTVNGSETNDIYILNVARNRYKQKLNVGSLELHISGAANPLKLIDDSTINPAVQVNGLDTYKIVSGTIAGGVVSTANDQEFGVLYPDEGVIVLGSTELDASASLATLRTSETNVDNHGNLFNHISASNYFSGKSEELLKSSYYFVRVKNGDYNFTSNPTFVSGSVANGIFRFQSMIGDPQVYITTIGLYNSNNELLAVGKLSKPLLKNKSRELLVRVKLDY
tara:strand:- start:39701 stop:40705 length:1005 start_codon:yes stop_codon:yes gene_type:complete